MTNQPAEAIYQENHLRLSFRLQLKFFMYDMYSLF